MAKKSETNNTVTVDAAKLAQGLKATFMGVAMVFDSLGAAGAAVEVKSAAEGVGKKKTAVTETTESVEETATGNAVDHPAEDEPPFDIEEDKASPSPTVTVDDITKVIVAKIKQKRSNNEKIGSLLKTYGVDKVSNLPSEKYEAFLTDISQL